MDDLSGFNLSQAMNSFKSFAGTALLATSSNGASASSKTGSKSFTTDVERCPTLVRKDLGPQSRPKRTLSGSDQALQFMSTRPNTRARTRPCAEDRKSVV